MQQTPSGLRDSTRFFSHLTQDPGETSGLPLPPRGGAPSQAAKPERGREIPGRPPPPTPHRQPRPPVPHQGRLPSPLFRDCIHCAQERLVHGRCLISKCSLCLQAKPSGSC